MNDLVICPTSDFCCYWLHWQPVTIHVCELIRTLFIYSFTECEYITWLELRLHYSTEQHIIFPVTDHLLPAAETPAAVTESGGMLTTLLHVLWDRGCSSVTRGSACPSATVEDCVLFVCVLCRLALTIAQMIVPRMMRLRRTQKIGMTSGVDSSLDFRSIAAAWVTWGIEGS